jgi:hypothetical protein
MKTVFIESCKGFNFNSRIRLSVDNESNANIYIVSGENSALHNLGSPKEALQFIKLCESFLHTIVKQDAESNV